ncbi:uncharacterized protein LOC123537804 [Mercenaria mercenaria]|uniref:uncharacterized protein LOC123537804 n=1 Tax=Mercenaria mercenaria TaxID=6596 RepID=UPI00234F029B|nr:uncharacterized protein LOC123537804 [Mercenaria mercenaria]
MGNRLSKPTNHLELYLNDVFKRECLFETHVADNEVEFIQTGIETLVQRIADQVLADHDVKEKIKMVAEELGIVIETPGPTNVLKVGSFYEGTKNKFPDEFDFTLVLGCLTGDMAQHASDVYMICFLADIYIPIEEVCKYSKYNGQTLVYTGSKCEAISEEQKLFFDWTVERNAPAINLKFIYQRGLEEMQPILVDLVPAVRCFDPHLIENIHTICFFEPFCEEVRKTGNILFVSNKFSFTETEVYFMKHVLSKNHKKVYRVLKYIINGHGDDEKLRIHLPTKAVVRDDGIDVYSTEVYSSYMIKIMIIHHHYLCSNDNKTEIGPCILQVLNDLCKYKNIKTFPFLTTSTKIFPHKFRLLPYLEHLAEYLQSMRAQNGVYDYEKERLNNSVSKQCADDFNFEFGDSDDYM